MEPEKAQQQIEGKSYTLKNLETKFKINKDLSCNSKTVIYIIECNKCKEIYIGSTQALNTRISLHKSNIKITENRKLNVLKHLYEWSQGQFKFMPSSKTNNYTLNKKKKNLKINLSPSWIKHELYTHPYTNVNIYIYIYTYIHTQKNN